MKKRLILAALLGLVAAAGFLSGKRAATMSDDTASAAAPAKVQEPAPTEPGQRAPAAALRESATAGVAVGPAPQETTAADGPLTGEMLAAIRASVEEQRSAPYLLHGEEEAIDAEGAYVQYVRWNECVAIATSESVALMLARVNAIKALESEDMEMQDRMLDAMDLMPQRQPVCDDVSEWEAKRQRYEWLEEAIRGRHPLAVFGFVTLGRDDLIDLELRVPGYLDRYRSTAMTALSLGVRSGAARGFYAYAEAILAEELLELDYAELLAYATAAQEAQRVLDVSGSDNSIAAFHYDLSELVEVAEARLSLEEIRDARARGRDLCDRYCYGRD